MPKKNFETFSAIVVYLVVACVKASRMLFPVRTKYDVCVIKTDRIGDFVLAIGAIRYIALRHKGQRKLLVVAPQLVEFAKTQFEDWDIIGIPLPPDWGMRKLHKAAWVLPPLLLRKSSTQTINLRQGDCLGQRLLSAIISGDRGIEIMFRKRSGMSKHILEEHAELLSVLYKQIVPVAMLKPSISLDGKVIEVGQDLLIAPFGTSPIRDLPISAAVEAARACIPNVFRRVIVVGTTDQLSRLEVVARKFRDAGLDTAIELPTSLSALCDRIVSSKLVLAVESGVAHIAVALDAPVVAIIGGGHYGRFGPWVSSERQVWITKRLPCFNCDWRCSRPQVECIQNVSKEDIVSSICKIA